MIIYKVYENISRSDSDGWQYWVEERIISYHSTIEGAQKKVKNLITLELDRLSCIDPSDNFYMESNMSNVSNNNVILPVGNNGEGKEEMELYSITPINVED